VRGVVGPFGPCCPFGLYRSCAPLCGRSGLVGVAFVAQWKIPERTSNERHHMVHPGLCNLLRGLTINVAFPRDGS